MKNCVIILFFFFLAQGSFAQNLCSNPSFEIFTSCPTSVAQVPNAPPWANPVNHSGSADYFHTCASGLVAVPNNFIGNEMPATGQAYIGLALSYLANPNFREYVVVSLTQPLVAGQCYEWSFKYSLSDGGQYATDRMQAYFSAAAPTGTGSWNPLPLTPQAENPLGSFLNVTNGWTLVTIQFTATGGEQYMTIGNFYNDAATALQVTNPSPAYGACYIYLDDIAVTPCTTSSVLAASPNDTICLGQSTTLTSSGGPGSYWWSTSSLPNDTVAVGSPAVVSPTVTTTYIVNSGSQTATVTVTVINPPVVTAGNDTSVCAGVPVTFAAQSPPGNSYLWSNSAVTQSVTVTTPGQYVVTVTNTFGCTSTDTVNLANFSSPTVNLASTSICQGGQATLDAGNPGCTYSWNTGDTTQIISISNPGTYSVVVTNAGGCTGSASVNIGNLNTVVASIAPNMISCFGGNDGSATASTTGGTGPYSYLWSNADTNGAISNLTSGSYTVTITDANGCFDSAVVIITEPSLLTMQATAAPSAVCSGQQVSLSATPGGGTPLYGIVWMPGNMPGGSQTITPTSTTTYSATVTDANGCSATTTALVAVNPVPAAAFVGDSLSGCAPVCVNFSDMSTVVSPGVITSWDWDFGDQSTSTQQNPNHCYSTPGVYTVILTVITADGCLQTITMTNYISVYASPVASFIMNPQPTTVINAQIYFTDSSSNAAAWLWTFGDGLNTTSTLQNPTFTYDQPSCYPVTLTVTSSNGCTDITNDSVCVDPDISIYVPNAFTPNGNNNNEIFIPVTLGIDPARYQFWVFDRWGNLIFQTTDLNQGWDGRANGGSQIAQIDTYVWKVVAWDVSGNMHSLIGSVNLIK